MRQVLAAMALVGVWMASGGLAQACTDAGPPNRSCSDEPAAWTSCDTHDDCGMGQTCSENGYCQCGECRYGEICMGGECACGRQQRPSAPAGCEVFTDSCGNYGVSCPADAGRPTPGDPCMPDGGEPPPECRSGSFPRESSGGGGCSAGGAGGASFVWLALVGLVRRRRR
ncbi:MAG: hypothetical protein H6721_30305 [Sandaracinus sp.]|nr:hypothetical protein [Myxococcales bacterium]MCB9614260.1 hypothetical protein [Sandaracinus sp.]MCB9621568.1 hypothetical protein [Sandaracinus sp.]MCB9636422.1 hypothetical protein [Sandaracinus sp.]